MIKVTREILDRLEIGNIFLSGTNENEKWLLRLVELGEENWICSLDSCCFITNVTCSIKIKDDYCKVPVEIELIEGSVYRLSFNDKKSSRIKSIMEKIKMLEREFSFLEKRRERRYDIGLKGSRQFGIVEMEKQNIIFKGSTLPCFFNNVSYNGCSITTVQTELQSFVIGDEVTFKLGLSNPLEQLFMKGKICSVALKTPQNENHFKFAILSVNLIEPPVAWNSRLSAYIKTQEM